jgi:hypothetical protein
MKTLTIYLPFTILLYVIISLSGYTLSKYFAFSSFVYLLLALIAYIGITFILKIYKEEKSCFSFSKVTSMVTILFFIILSTNSLLTNTYDSEKIFDYQILSLNHKLPIMIDKNTRFDKVYISDNNVYYQYTMTNLSTKKANKDLLTLALTDKIYSTTGNLDIMLLKLSKKPRVINYIFHDKESNFLTKVEIKLN